MAITNAALASEIANNPNGLTDPVSGKTLPQLAAIGHDQDIAAALNLVRVGAPYVVFRNDVLPKEIIQCIAGADFTAANQLTVSKLQLFLMASPIDVTLTNVQANLKALFSGASAATVNALTAVCTRQGSRAEVLGGTGTVVLSTDVGAAR